MCLPQSSVSVSCNSILYVAQVRILGVVLEATFLPSYSIDLICKSWQLYLQYVFIIQPLLTTSSYPLVQGFPDPDHRSSLPSNLQLSPTSLLQSVLYTAVREIRLFHSSAQNSPWFLFSFRVKAQILTRACKSLCDMALPTSLPPSSIAHSSLTTLAFLLFLIQYKLLSKFRALELVPPPAQDVPAPRPSSIHFSTSFKCHRGLPQSLIWSSSPHHTLLFSALMFLHNTHYHMPSYYLFSLFFHQYFHDKVPQGGGKSVKVF